jgi:nucleotide-binding universal stress UspA family protein
MTDTQAVPTHRIVVGIDGSPSSVAALQWAARQADLTGSNLEAITTWEWPTSFGSPLPFPSDYDPEEDARTMLKGVIGQVMGEHPGISVQATIVEGRPAMVLVEASERADLLVVGSRGHGEFAGMLLGSVSEHCVTNAHCPVLVLRAPEHGGP